MIIETKYSVGDKVWGYEVTYETVRRTCPDCDGAKVLRIEGKELDLRCPTCSYGYESRGFVDDQREWRARPTVRTIGQVQVVHTGPSWGREDDGDERQAVQVPATTEIKYMCRETGVGSGTVHDERRLFWTIEEAQAAGDVDAIQRAEDMRKSNEAEMDRRRKREVGRVKRREKKDEERKAQLKAMGIEV